MWVALAPKGFCVYEERRLLQHSSSTQKVSAKGRVSEGRFIVVSEVWNAEACLKVSCNAWAVGRVSTGLPYTACARHRAETRAKSPPYSTGFI